MIPRTHKLPVKPADALHSMGAPREIVEWVRKMPSAEAARMAWIDVARADWMPYIASLRGSSHDAIVRATCACLVDLAGTDPDPIHDRLMAVLREGIEHGRKGLAPAATGLEDLRLKMIAHGDAASPPAWTLWCKLVLELARASGRGNPLIGVALALRMIVEVRGRKANADLITRFRDKLTLGA